jgi:hypothetical protein
VAKCERVVAGVVLASVSASAASAGCLLEERSSGLETIEAGHDGGVAVKVCSESKTSAAGANGAQVLFVAEGRDGVDGGGATCRNVAGCDGHGDEQ